jgi:serine phosphatase RsbU (regulator of sigma subunit)
VTDRDGHRVEPLHKSRITIGRRASADVQVAGASVSRQHAELTLVEGRVLLRDTGSRWGTFVNGERVTACELTHGDHVRLGTADAAQMVLLVDPPAAPSAGETAGAVGQVAALLDGLRAVGSGRVLEEVLTIVLDAALEVTRAERGFVMLANAAGELEFKAARAAGRVTLPGATFATSTKIPREVYATGNSRLVRDLTDLALLPDHGGTIAQGIRQVLCVPLRVTPAPAGASAPASPRVIGVLYFDGRERSALMSASGVSTLEAFAAQAALAIENARLYAADAERARIERELRVAGDMQRALLPPPSFADSTCSLAAMSLPSHAVGGDFFDYFTLPDGVAVALGDVAGKGTPAALLAAVVQSTFAAQAAVEPAPDAAMFRINEALLRRGIEARFATMFYGLLAADGTLRYCNAGQEPPLAVSATGHAWLDTGGPVIGMLSGVVYSLGTLSLAPGDFIVVCSDGLTEALNPAGQEFGRDRLAAAVLGLHGASAADVLRHVEAALRRFTDGVPLRDDTTVMVIRRT